MVDSIQPILAILVPALASIACASFSYFSAKEAKESKKYREQNEKNTRRRITEQMLSMKLMNANCQLTLGTAVAIKEGHANGQMDEGLNAVKEAQSEYDTFIKQIASEDLNSSH